jgi:hypothetical protein
MANGRLRALDDTDNRGIIAECYRVQESEGDLDRRPQPAGALRDSRGDNPPRSSWRGKVVPYLLMGAAFAAALTYIFVDGHQWAASIDPSIHEASLLDGYVEAIFRILREYGLWR